MIKDLRERYNQNFTAEKYANFLQDLGNEYGYMPSFRISETPVFIPEDLKAKLISAGEDLIKTVTSPDFKQLSIFSTVLSLSAGCKADCHLSP